METVNQALEYLDEGLSIIPIRPDTKRPAIKWMEYQHRQPTADEVTDWFEKFPDANIAVVTGSVSGVVIVDCDNEDALNAAISCGMQSNIRVKTKRGHHLWFKHPMDGVRRGPRAGGNSRGHDWPRVNGLDFRGDGSYALLPPSKGYEWAVPEGWERDDDMPVWEDWSPVSAPIEFPDLSFEDLDLSSIQFDPADKVSEWDRTEEFVKRKGVS